jgi:rhodanese-related sulfurtransferase
MLCAGLMLLVGIGTAAANTGETPPSLDGARTISAADAKALLERGAVVLDVRRKAAFLEGRVPRAKGLARNAETKAFDPAAFGPNKEATLLIYGHGSDGWSAVEAVRTAVGAGYRNVHWMRGGWVEWSAAGLPSEQ